jgi:hypothetical protein
MFDPISMCIFRYRLVFRLRIGLSKSHRLVNATFPILILGIHGKIPHSFDLDK